MKTLFNLFNGALTITEQGGVISLNFNDQVQGIAPGIVKGQGSIQLNAQQGLLLGEQLLNAHLPAGVQALAAVIEGVANQAIAAIE